MYQAEEGQHKKDTDIWDAVVLNLKKKKKQRKKLVDKKFSTLEVSRHEAKEVGIHQIMEGLISLLRKQILIYPKVMESH